MDKWNDPKSSDFVMIDNNFNELYLVQSKLKELEYFITYFESEIGDKSTMRVEYIEIVNKLLFRHFHGGGITIDLLEQLNTNDLFYLTSLVFEWLLPKEYKESIFIYIDKNLNKILSEDSSYGVLIYNYFGDFISKVYDKKSKNKSIDTYTKLDGKVLTNKIIMRINLNYKTVDSCYIDSPLSKLIYYNIYNETCFIYYRYDKIKNHPDHLKYCEYPFKFNEMIDKYFDDLIEDILILLNDIFADKAIKLCVKFGKYDLIYNINNKYSYINDYFYISNYLSQIRTNKEYLLDKNIIKIIDPYLYAKMCIELSYYDKLINIKSYWTSIQKAFQDYYKIEDNIFTKCQLNIITSVSNIISYEDIYLTGDKVLRLSSFYPFKGDLILLVGKIEQIKDNTVNIIPKRDIKIKDILLYEGLEYNVIEVEILDKMCKITTDQIIINTDIEAYNLYKIEEII